MIEQNFIEDNILLLSKQTMDLFLKQDNPGNLISLYMFYYYTAKWQKTNQPKCTTNYAANGLKWSNDKVRKYKKVLIKLGLIQDIRNCDDKGKILGWYIKINYIWKKETVNKAINDVHTNEKPERGKNHSVGKNKTNALSASSLNALNANNKILLPNTQEKIVDINKNKEKNNKLTIHQKYINLFTTKYKDTFNIKYQFQYGKDAKHIKLLKQYTNENIEIYKKILDVAFKDPYWSSARNMSPSILVQQYNQFNAKANGVINKTQSTISPTAQQYKTWFDSAYKQTLKTPYIFKPDDDQYFELMANIEDLKIDEDLFNESVKAMINADNNYYPNTPKVFYNNFSAKWVPEARQELRKWAQMMGGK